MKKRNHKLLLAVVLGLLMAICFTATVSAAAYKNEIVEKDGKQYYYDSKGKIVKGKYGYKIGNKYYKISKSGILTRVSKEEGEAGLILNPYYGKYSKPEILWKAFQWSANLRYSAISTKVPSGQKKESYFGLYGFKYKRGDCNVQAATFYWMAKVLGYKIKFVQGYVPTEIKNGKFTKFGAHAWTTLTAGKNTYVYDPNLNGTHGKKYGYKRQYGSSGTYRYCNLKKQEIKK